MVCPTDTIIDTLKSELRYDDAAGDLFWTKAGRGRRLNRPAGFVGFGGYRSLKFQMGGDRQVVRSLGRLRQGRRGGCWIEEALCGGDAPARLRVVPEDQ